MAEIIPIEPRTGNAV